MKKPIFILLLLLFALCTQAQQKASYAYDAAGNRISRTIVMGKQNVETDDKNNLPTQTTFFEEMLSEKQLKIYPNPVESLLTVEVSDLEPASHAELSLFDEGGRLLLRRVITESTTVIDMSLFITGNYLMRIVIENNQSIWKIIKK